VEHLVLQVLLAQVEHQVHRVVQEQDLVQ
jgi:hypothetical protein